MKVKYLLVFLVALLIILGCTPKAVPDTSMETIPATSSQPATLKLPEPILQSEVSLEEALRERRSTREYANVPLTLSEVAQLLWAAQGVTSEWGGRTAPSAGALYPLEVYLAAGNVESLAPGVYKYNPERHELVRVRDGDVRGQLAKAALGQRWVQEGAVDIVIAAIYERTTVKYGDRGIRYVHMEAGHAAENICLQAAALDLGVVTVGAFYDDLVRDIMGMLADEIPLYVIPIGKKT
jgi:SagB-type dehydrogenase family enzyme